MNQLGVNQQQDGPVMSIEQVAGCIISTYLRALTYLFTYTVGYRLMHMLLYHTQRKLSSNYVVLYRRTQAQSLGLWIFVESMACAVTVPTVYLYSTKVTAVLPWTSHTEMPKTLRTTMCAQ